MDRNKIFPPEIIEFSVENYFVKQNKKSSVIYISIVTSIFAILILLPFIHIDVTTQSRGIIRSSYETNKLFSAVYAEVIQSNLCENYFVEKGDTLILLKTEKIDEQIRINQLKKRENELFVSELKSLIEQEQPKLKTNTYISEYLAYVQELKSQELVVSYLEKEFKLDEHFFEKEMIAKVEFEKKRNDFDLARSKLKLIKEQ